MRQGFYNELVSSVPDNNFFQVQLQLGKELYLA
jgi:hypothetical protein